MNDLEPDTERNEVNVGIRMRIEHRAMLERLAERRATSISATIRQLVIEETERVATQTLPSFTISA